MQPLIPAAALPVVLASAWTPVGVVLLWIVAVLVALVALVVLVPIHVRAAGSVDNLSLSGQARIRWAWGVLSVHLSAERDTTVHLFGLRIWTLDQGEPDDAPRPKKRRARGRLQWLLQNRQTGLRFMKRLIRTLRLQLRLQGELGLADPAATALLTWLVAELDRASPSVRLRVAPDWVDERVQLDGEVRARIWLAHIGLVLLAGLAHRETRQMIRTAIRAGR